MDKTQWSKLLEEAVNTEGLLSKCYSTFHNYSIGNQLLAMSQMSLRGIPLGPIATYKKWLELGRQVKKGEKALQLSMPVSFKDKKDDTKVVQMFLLKNNWFALSQTDGEEYSPPVVIPEWDKQMALSKLNIQEVRYESTDGNCQGYAEGNTFAVNPVAILPHKTTFHELAHIVLGHTKEHTMADSEITPRDIREVEAEAVAYICCSQLGLSGLVESRGYIQNWLQGDVIPEKSAQKIFSAANKILTNGRNTNEQV